MKIEGKVMGETVVEGVSAEEMWKVYGGRELADLLVILFKDQLDSLRFLEGDGGVGTIIQVTFKPGILYFIYICIYIYIL